MDLQIIWFFLWGLLWAVFFMTDGFDFGIGTLFPFIARNETERRTMMHAMGPFWDGNEVWLIAAGGVTFAAFPTVYAVMFSSLYSALMLILFALILRGVAMEFYHQSDNPAWKSIWTFCIFFGSLVPAILFGVAFANIFQGIPFDGEGVYQGNLFSLLNAYGLLGGALFLFLFLEHGALWLAIKAEGELHERSVKFAGSIWWLLLATAVVFLIATKFKTPLYDNYYNTPILFLLILINVAALVQIKVFLTKKKFFTAWFSSALTIVCCTFFGVIGLFPNVFPSSLDPAYSLTAFNASSSPLTLKIMLIVTVIFVPIVIAYQTWAYNLFKGKVTEEDLAEEGY
jgi:cytochrome d ubiquinol oxidase subunit II